MANRSRRRRRGSRRYRRNRCRFCEEHVEHIDYKNVDMLRQFVTSHGKIRSRRQTGTCARHQRRVAIAIKRARHIALLPFAANHGARR